MDKEKIFKMIFFDDKGNRKVKLWLMKVGVLPNDVDDMEANFQLSFWEMINKYKYDKIPIEKWIWQDFKYWVIDYFAKRNKRRQKAEFITESDLLFKKYDIGDISDNSNDVDELDIVIDFENIISIAPTMTQTIARVLFYSDWSKSDIVKYFQISGKCFDDNIKIIEKIFKDNGYSLS